MDDTTRMLIFRGLHSTDKQSVALTIGNFDGIHLGHQALLQQLGRAAQSLKLPTAVLVFEPHPREFFTPGEAPARLSSLREKLDFFATQGVDRVHVCRFDHALSQMSAHDFVCALCERAAAQFVLVGDDFRFGNRRSGDLDLIERVGGTRGLTVSAMSGVLHDDVRVSSTRVRAALLDGDLSAAQRYLGRPYSISGRVVYGDGLGSQLGFPTANIQLKHNRPPLTGIFVVKVQGEGMPPMQGVASLGVRPTINQSGRHVLEVYIFNFSGKIYNQHLRVDFLHKLRDEEKYPDLASLTKQIALDAENAKQWFKQND